MSFASPAGLWALALAIPIIALHILKSRRVELKVSSTLGWDELDRPVAAARPWQRLRWSIPLVLQLLLVALLALALAQPSLNTGKVSAQHLVVILDTSSSMGATDGTPTRLAEANDVVKGLASEMGDGAVVSVITAGAPAQVVASSLAPSAIGSRLESIKVSEGSFDGEAASSLALGMDSPDRSVAYALVSDGGLQASDVRLLPAGTEFHRVGKRDRNLGVTNVVVSAAGAQTHLQVTISNSGSSRATTVARVDVDGRDVGSRSVTVPGRDSLEVGFDVVNGEQIEVHLDIDDLLVSDNHAYAAGPSARTLKVLLVGPGNPFLEALLAERPTIELTQLSTPDQLKDTAGLTSFDVTIFDRVAVPSDVSVPFLAVSPPGGAPGVAAKGSVEAPVAALVRSDNPLLEGLDLTDLAIAKSQDLDAPAATTLVGSEQTPLIVQGSQEGQPFVYVGFALNDSNLGLLPAFPLLGDRIITTLGGADLASGSLAVGDPLPLEVGSDATVESPSGTRTAVNAGGVAPELDRTGIWTIETAGGPEKGGQRRLAVVNPPPTESEIAPRSGLAIPGVEKAATDGGAPVQRSLVFALIAIACLVVLAEWWFSSRRRGVVARQWRIASGVRAAVLVALLLAMVVPTFTVRSSHVAAVFVVDVSDSMAGGRSKSIESVRRAIAEMPSGSAAGVVAVGADARVDAAVAESLSWSGVDVTVDGSATNLAAGIRVAGAMASGEYARRVVLISDGRPTTGDLQAEAQRLRRAGVRLDVVPVSSAVGPDVMLSSVEAPDRARPGDALKIVVRVRATEAQRVSVSLRRNDVEVDRRIVETAAGDTAVEFTQPPGPPGTVRWSASVAGPSNGIVENDIGRASTRIEGQAQVLVVEGAPGESAELTRVFESFGASVTTVAPEELTDLAGLANNDAVVLVDVPLTALSTAQITAISTATRDLGTGLVTLGGTSSYGAGEYLGSTLEELLPVVSEVRDPKRRSKVAQVFAVDVSGSMGACHCADDADGSNSRLGGGIKKTDIARDAAVMALEGIEPNDELGVLVLDDNFRWVRDIAPVGDGKEARREMGAIKTTEGGTNLEPGLSVSAESLKKSDASLRHIVLFTDGFEDTSALARLRVEAGELRDSGITVSVMGTGEGAARELRAIADAGGGRYYPGRDLSNLPNLLLQETKVVSRQLIVEGDFLPERSSDAPIIASLDTAPQVKGYVATTAKPTAVQHLVVGAEKDPLLASWQVGLGKVASWTSDVGNRWAGDWVTWEGAPTFWADVLRSVYRAPSGSLQVRFDGAAGRVVAGFDEPVPDGATVKAVVVAPDGSSSTVPLRRIDDRSYEADFSAGRPGSYAIGVTSNDGQKTLAAVTGVAELGYSLEYSSQPPDPDLLTSVSLRSGGRGQIRANEAFAAAGLEPGRRLVDLRMWLLIFAALAWPLAVALSRLRFASGPDALIRRERLGRVGAVADAVTRTRTKSTVREPQRATPDSSSATAATASPPSPSPPTAPPERAPGSTPTPSSSDRGSKPASDAPAAPTSGSSVDSLLAAKRAKRRPEKPEP